MLRDFARCEECGRLILGREDGGPGARAAVLTAAQLGGRRVQFTRRQGAFHESCLAVRVAFHRRRARCVAGVTALVALVAAVVTRNVGGHAEVALLLASLGAYAAYLEAHDVRPLPPSSAPHVRLIIPS
jgi:hypothetical protein